MVKWRRFIVACALCLGLLLSSPVQAASSSDQDAPAHDARTEGYQPKAQLDSNSTALLWLAFAFLSVVALSVLFKNAKRTHLD